MADRRTGTWGQMVVLAVLATLVGTSPIRAQAQVPGAPIDISRPANQPDDLLLLYRHTVYNNYAALAFGENCSLLNANEIDALRSNIEKLAVDFRDRFAYNRDQWFGMVRTMEQRYQREEPECSNRTARKFSQDVSRDIVALTR